MQRPGLSSSTSGMLLSQKRLMRRLRISECKKTQFSYSHLHVDHLRGNHITCSGKLPDHKNKKTPSFSRPEALTDLYTAAASPRSDRVRRTDIRSKERMRVCIVAEGGSGILERELPVFLSDRFEPAFTALTCPLRIKGNGGTALWPPESGSPGNSPNYPTSTNMG